MSINIPQLLCPVVFLALLSNLAAQPYPQMLVQDPFTDGGVTDGTDPLDVRWFNSDGSTIQHTVVEDSSLDATAPHQVADFLIGNPVVSEKDDYIWFILPQVVDLAVGEAIEVSYRMRFSGGLPRTDASRTGVSLGYRTSGNAPWSDAGNQEYFFMTSFGSAGTLGSIRKSIGSQFLNTADVLASDTASVNLGSAVGTVLFEVARITDTAVRLRYRLNGGPVQEAIDEGATFFRFDRVMLRYRRATTAPLESMRMDDVTVRLIEADLSPRIPVTWHVSPQGDDGATGEALATPFRTISRAVQWARAGDTILIRGGTYHEAVSTQASGTAELPITFSAYIDNGVPEEVVITGFDPITPGAGGAGTWELHAPNIWKIALPPGNVLDVGRNMVSLDGELLIPARWPDAIAPVDFDRSRMATASAGTIDIHSIGTQPPYSTGDFYTGTYTDAAITAFPTDALAGAHMDLCAGHNWWPKTAVVTGNNADVVTFRYRFSDTWDHVLDTPKQMDRYTIWGHLAVLDSPGEFFIDANGLHGTADMLYVYLADGANPSAQDLLVLTRVETLKVNAHAHLKFAHLKILGGTVSTAVGSSDVEFDHIEVDYGTTNRNLLIGSHGSAVLLNGENHTFANGRVGMTDGRALDARGLGGMVLFNNVMHTATSHLLSLDYAINTTAEYNTGFEGGSVGAAIGAKATTIRFNHFYEVGKRMTDLAIMNTWNSGDMQGTEVAYNWAHSNRAPRDGSLSWWGGQGIRLDSGGAPLGCSNTVIHHNVVWDTTSDSGITAWGLEEGMVNYGDSKIHVYHNTMENYLVFGGRGSVAGSDLRNNIALGFNNAVGDMTGATFLDNLFAIHDVANNLYANPGYVSSRNRNYQLRTDSPASNHGTAIPAITETSSVGYLGAYNPDAAPWRPGARLRAVDLPQLVAAIQRNALGEAFVRVSGLPIGRTFTDAFALRVAGRSASAMNVRYLFDSHQVEALFTVDLSGLSGAQPYEVSLDGLTFTATTQATVLVTQPELLAVADNEALPTGTSSHSINLVHVAGDPRRRIPLRLSGLTGADLSTQAVPWVVDTSAWVADGMAADGSDLRFFAFDGNTPVRHHVESGIGQTNTLIWLLQDNAASASGNIASFEDHSILYLSYGYDLDASVDDPAVLTDSFSALASPNRLLHLRANDFAASHSNGDAVAIWPDRTPADASVIQPNPAAQPAYRPAAIGGLPALEFDGGSDGSGDHFDVNGAAGLGTGPGRFFVVYRNPDPGTVKWQRLYSGRTDTNMQDYIDGYYASVPSTGDGFAIGSLTPTISDQNIQKETASGENFRIAMRSLNTAEAYRGEIAEIIGFSGEFVGSQRDGLLQYLRRKYAIIDRPGATLDHPAEIPGLRVLVNGVAATGLQWLPDGSLGFNAPPYAGVDPLPAKVDLTVQLADGSNLTMPEAFTYRTAAQAWLIDHFGDDVFNPELEASLWGWTSNPDKDQLNNLMELALGGMPQTPSTAAIPFIDNHTGHLRITFNRARADLRYQVLVGNDLSGWTVISTDPGSVGNPVTVSDPVPLDPTNPRRFIRLRVNFP